MKVCACSGETLPKSGAGRLASVELRIVTSLLVIMCVFVYATTLTIEQVLAALEAQPKAIAELTGRLSPPRLQSPPADEEWSLNDVLAHLRSCADVWGRYIVLIVEEDHPVIGAVNPRTWIKSTGYPGLDFTTSFAQFTKQRRDLVRYLVRLPKDAWSRSATVTGGGRPRERTVLEYARWLANHERTHLRQITRLSERRP